MAKSVRYNSEVRGAFKALPNDKKNDNRKARRRHNWNFDVNGEGE